MKNRKNPTRVRRSRRRRFTRRWIARAGAERQGRGDRSDSFIEAILRQPLERSCP